MSNDTLNEDAVKHVKQLIDAQRYVLRSRWQDWLSGPPCSL